MNTNNLILATDSYKLGHWNQYPKDTESVYSYFESRKGAAFPYTVFFGLQYLLKKYMVGQCVTYENLSEARSLSAAHFGNNETFNYRGWNYIIDQYGGRLPLRIKAVPEGTVVPTDNVLMTVESTDPKCYWLTNAMETLLTHVWYPSTVATLSHYTIHEIIEKSLKETAHDTSGLPFMLHDFGERSATTAEAAGIGGAAHLLNSFGTDTIPGMLVASQYYGADLDNLAFSVPATEHSVMTAEGPGNDLDVLDRLLDEYPSGILSVVADSYNVYEFVRALGTPKFKDRILARDGKLVVRPDSVTKDHPTPESLTVWIMSQLWQDFGGHPNEKGYRVLDPHVGVLWGDGIDPKGIAAILDALAFHSFSTENMVFGMGSGLLQKIDRDTQRFAFKASAIKRDGVWHDVFKDPVDSTKKSKRGRLRLCMTPMGYQTIPESHDGIYKDFPDELQTVFENGKLLVDQSFIDIRKRAGHPAV